MKFPRILRCGLRVLLVPMGMGLSLRVAQFTPSLPTGVSQ